MPQSIRCIVFVSVIALGLFGLVYEAAAQVGGVNLVVRATVATSIARPPVEYLQFGDEVVVLQKFSCNAVNMGITEMEIDFDAFDALGNAVRPTIRNSISGTSGTSVVYSHDFAPATGYWCRF